jgi:predicted NBD/HSP70 family sugar kinase
MLISPPLLRNWSNVDIPAYLRYWLKLKEDFPIYLENDANLGALGESRYGKGQGIANLIYVKLGTGIGAGLILNGQLYRGSGGLAGELGHIKIEDESPKCPSCDKCGCLEALAGREAILDDARNGRSLSRSHRSANKRIPYGTPALADYTGEIDMADVIIEAKKGDAASRAALQWAGKRIGTAIGSYLINVYNPSMILLDWGTIRAIKDDIAYRNELLLGSLYQSAADSSLPKAWAGTKIEIGQLGDSAIALGAVATVIDNDVEFGLPNRRILNPITTT